MDQIKCPTCSSRLTLPVSVIGREVKCPRCQATFVARLDLALGPRLGNVGYANLTSGDGADHAWKEGARVFAPWEEEWLYPGVIRCLDDDVAFIKFDDGDRALLPVDALQPVRVQKGDLLFSRRDKGPQLYYPAKVLRANGEEIELEYQDGGREETTVSYVRFPRRGR